MNKELKAIEVLKENKILMINFVDSFDDDSKDDDEYISACKYIEQLSEAIKELEEYEQKFKQKEFDYRTQCQSVLSAGRVEADNIPDRLAELEKVILYYYLGKGYEIGVGGWGFNVEIESNYKSKQLLVYFREAKDEHYDQILKIEVKTTKEMWDKAIAHFSSRQNEVIKSCFIQLHHQNQLSQLIKNSR